MKDDEYNLKIKQLEILEGRMKHHIVKFWSLPLAYLGLSLLLLTKINESPPESQQISYGFIVLLGFVIYSAMYGSHEGTKRAIENIEAIELQLLPEATVRYFWAHYLPYVFLVCIVQIYAIIKLIG